MNKKIKILGLSAFIATGMTPLGATQVFADEANPTQIEEQLDVDENSDIDSIEEEARENQIEDIEEQEIVDQESQEEQDIENTNESEDISSNEDQGAEDGDLVTVINEDMHTQGTEIEDNDQDLDENENIDVDDADEEQDIDKNNEDKNLDEENQDIDVDDVEKDQDIDNNESDQFELIGKPNNSDIPKTSDAGIGGYVGTMVAAIGGLFALIKKMI